MPAIGEREALEAGWTLFGGAADPAFLRSLDLATVKRAFRDKALLLHPDRFAAAGEALRRRQTARFQAISGAYETLLRWLDGDREDGTSGTRAAGTPARPPAAPPSPAARADEPFGRFLAHRGVISRRALLDALVWQRRGRPRIGELAVRWGWLTPAQVDEVLAARRAAPHFADRAVELGLLSPFRARTLLRFQRTRQRRLGDYFVEHGVLARERIERLAGEHRAVAAPARRAASRA